MFNGLGSFGTTYFMLVSSSIVYLWIIARQELCEEFFWKETVNHTVFWAVCQCSDWPKELKLQWLSSPKLQSANLCFILK